MLRLASGKLCWLQVWLITVLPILAGSCASCVGYGCGYGYGGGAGTSTRHEFMSAAYVFMVHRLPWETGAGIAL